MIRGLIGFIFLLLMAYELGIVFFDLNFFSPIHSPIKVGLVHSLSGDRAYKEESVKNASLLAIREINRQGGILGRQIEPIVRDAASNWETTQQQIENLILEEKVDVIFGCSTKGSLYKAKQLFERLDQLLITPYTSESLIQSSHIVQLGIHPIQKIIPTIDYCFHHSKTRFYFVGSDDTYPHIISMIMKDYIRAKGGELIGESYLSANSEEIDTTIEAIKKNQPDAIFNCIQGLQNKLFYKQLRQAGLSSEKVPSFSFTITESLLPLLEIEEMVGDYATSNYFQSLDKARNHQFIEAFNKEFDHTIIDNSAESGYLSVYAWAQAAKETGHTSRKDILYALKDMRLNTPEGLITMDSNGRAAWRSIRIGRIEPDGQFAIIWESEDPLRPDLYPLYRSQTEWEHLTESFFRNFNPTEQE